MLVLKYEMGMFGINLMLTMTYAFIFISLNLYPLIYSETRHFIQRPSKEALQNLTEYLEKGLSLSLMLFFEWTA